MSRPEALFFSGPLFNAVRGRELSLKQAAAQIPPEQTLALSVEELAAQLVEQFRIEPLELAWGAMTQSSADTKVDVTDDPRRFIFQDDGRVLLSGTTVTFHIPFSGERDLFKFQPSTHTMNPPRGLVTGNELRLIATAPADRIEAIKGELEAEVAGVKLAVKRVNADVDSFNRGLPALARQVAQQRREKVIADVNLVASLGVPLRRREDAPQTYAVAPVRRAVTRPATGRRTGRPEPALSAEIYEQIVGIVRGMATVLERSPKAFVGMREEDLRQHFLVQLNGQFEGDATGETFNFEGDTDILVRRDGRNLFIAECKFWDGPARLTSTVNQILGYASWRDTKTAIFLFNRERALTTVLSKVSPTIRAHSNFVREIAYGDETEFRFVLHHRDDAERELTLTVLVFEVPGGQAPSA